MGFPSMGKTSNREHRFLAALVCAAIGSAPLACGRGLLSTVEETNAPPDTRGLDSGATDTGDALGSGLRFTQVATGNTYSCGLKSDGTLVCWGCYPSPFAGTLVQLSTARWYNGCGLDAAGNLQCWQVGGDACNGTQGTPPAGTFSQVTVGMCYACGLRSDGTIACWGTNDQGQASPPQGTFVQISAGEKRACALTADGTIACWGSGGSACPVLEPGETFTQVSVGSSQLCGLKTDGTVTCWGDNCVAQAIAISGTFTQIAAGPDHACALRSDGNVVCWGATVGADPPAGPFTQIAASFYHDCGVRADGTIACWGCTGLAGCGMCTPPSP